MLEKVAHRKANVAALMTPNAKQRPVRPPAPGVHLATPLRASPLPPFLHQHDWGWGGPASPWVHPRDSHSSLIFPTCLHPFEMTLLKYHLDQGLSLSKTFSISRPSPFSSLWFPSCPSHHHPAHQTHLPRSLALSLSPFHPSTPGLCPKTLLPSPCLALFSTEAPARNPLSQEASLPGWVKPFTLPPATPGLRKQPSPQDPGSGLWRGWCSCNPGPWCEGTKPGLA